MTARSGRSKGRSRKGLAGRLLMVTALVVCAALGLSAPVTAAPAAKTKVTIKAAGTDLFGYVKSPKPAKCADEREVTLFKVTRNGNQRIASDTASLNGDRYMWSTGNTGMTGKFYARAGKIPGCKADSSKTIRVQR